MEESNELKFFIHDELHSVKACDIPSDMTLNEYLRKVLGLIGTKVMCREGGCGACIVVASFNHPVTNVETTVAVNSCLVPIFLCSGWKIYTVEGIGNKVKGYHKIQSTLASFNGTQCGFCSSGWVMSMFGLMKKNNDKVTMAQVENSFGGNICRCTGYRPILSGFKSLATDATEEYTGRPVIPDIEDCTEQLQCLAINKKQQACWNISSQLFYQLRDMQWYKAETVDEIRKIFTKNPTSNIKLVCGNTAHGVYPDMAKSDIAIDINHVKTLRGYTLNTNNLEVGANMPLEEFMELCTKISSKDANFCYLTKIRDHIDLVAHVPVRNIGTIAGNLSIKFKHHEFPSDIFLLLETVGADLTIVDTNNQRTHLKPSQYLEFDMHLKLIEKVSLPALDKSFQFQSYKIMTRKQNTHALVNGGFLFQLNNGKVNKATVVYGAINPNFIHATNTEKYFIGKNLFDEAVLQGAFATLEKELVPDWILPDPSPDFRKSLAIALLYKCILSMSPTVAPWYASGGSNLKRPISKGHQEYDTHEDQYPLTQPVVKLEALAQTSGEAEYVMDIPDYPNQLYAAFVLAKAKATSTILNVDTSKALAVKGVVAYFDKDDVPGKNAFMCVETGWVAEEEEIFCSGTIKYFNQPIGIIVGKSQSVCDEAVKLVQVSYKIDKSYMPLLTVKDVLKSGKKDRIIEYNFFPAKSKGTDMKHEMKGEVDLSWQYHYHMETLCCAVIPHENDEYEVHPASQWVDLVQQTGAVCLDINSSKIHVQVRRCGGAYGAKISRTNLVSCAALIAAHKLKKPVKLWMPFMDNMDAIGKRNPLHAIYDVSTDDKGVIQFLDLKTYTDVGVANNEAPVVMLVDTLNQGYVSDCFQLDCNIVKTENTTCTWTRSPGSTEGSACIESIMEHIAISLNLDPLDVRVANIDKKNHPDLLKYIDDFKGWAKIDERKKDIVDFNKKNRWTKRGMSVNPLGYQLLFEGAFTVAMSVFHGDGSVVISHGGIELGQGINTKLAQVVAYSLGIPLDLITVKPTDTFSNPNTYVTGGSITSESTSMGLQKCCDELLERLGVTKPAKPFKPEEWKTLIEQKYGEGTDLATRYHHVNSSKTDYLIYGVVASEVEFDCLTGQHTITRVDLMEDTGSSISPLIDVGQVEGAFIMATGYWTTEEIIMDSTTGELKTNRTWTYKPSGAKDIPVAFNVKFPDNPNPASPFKTKATGEPPFCLGISVSFALRHAVTASKVDAKLPPDFIPTNGPSTVEKNFMDCKHDYKLFKLTTTN